MAARDQEILRPKSACLDRLRIQLAFRSQGLPKGRLEWIGVDRVEAGLLGFASGDFSFWTLPFDIFWGIFLIFSWVLEGKS